MITALRFGLAWLVTLVMGLVALLVFPVLGPERGWRLLAQRWGRCALWVTGVRLDIQGAEHLAKPAVFIINHLSLIDAVYIPALLPPTTRFVVKRSLASIPLWGWAMRAGGAILIDRGRSREAIALIREGVRRLPAGGSVGVFPEGTRSPDGTLQPFKRGAFRVAVESRLPVVPIGSAGPLDIVPKGTFLIRPGVVHVTVGAPISTEGWTHETLALHAAEGRAAVERCTAESERRRQAARAPVPEKGLRPNPG